MDYNSIWNDICFHANKNRNAEEKVFQAAMEFMFEKLGWSFRENIETQIPVRVGSGKREGIVDILINDNDEKAYVVELKRVGNNISKDDADQLRSYMRLWKLQNGVLLGSTLQIYYEKPSSSDPAVIVCDIQLVEDSEIGIECIKVLSNSNFSFDRFNAFCESCLLDPDKYIEMQKATSSKSSTRESKAGSNYEKHGKEFKGKDIYKFICDTKKENWHPGIQKLYEDRGQPGKNNWFLGKKRIEEQISDMDRSDIESKTFWLNNSPYSNNSSMTAERFKLLYESM